MRIQLEPSYILHTRPYRETSLLIYALTEQHGIVHLLSRGAKRKGRNLLQPFVRMSLSWSGRGELLSLTNAELESSNYMRNFRIHVQCFYLHELMLRLIPKMSPAPELFHLYESTLQAMIKHPKNEEVLRKFELQLLNIIGHPLQLKFDYQNEQKIEQNLYYRYEPEQGPTYCNASGPQWNIVSGALLYALAESRFNADTLMQAKVFLRGLLQHYLRGKPLVTRQLLRVG